MALSNMYKFAILTVLFVCCNQQVLHEGQECTIKDTEQKGQCLTIDKCPPSLSEIEKDIHPQLCGFDKSVPVACCTETPRNNAKKSLSEQKCEEYSKAVENIEAEFYTTVVGGSPTRPGEYPHMVALGYNNSDEISWQCGGTLISLNYVLTAAHCLISAENGPVSWVRVGEILIKNITKTSSSIDFRVIQRIAYPEYKPPSVYHDIALLQLDKNVNWVFRVKPACLPTASAINITGTTGLTATGWGLTEFNGEKSSQLLYVDLEEFTNEECNKIYKSQANSRRYKNGIVSDLQICAGGRDVEKDTCQGDSGGPLQVKKFRGFLHRVIGVTSFGKGCGVKNIPGVYVRVSKYVPWIESIVWKT